LLLLVDIGTGQFGIGEVEALAAINAGPNGTQLKELSIYFGANQSSRKNDRQLAEKRIICDEARYLWELKMKSRQYYWTVSIWILTLLVAVPLNTGEYGASTAHVFKLELLFNQE